MISERFLVITCRKCNKPALLKVTFEEYENKCCLDFNNHKVLKVFNDETEAKNYFRLHKQDEE